MALNRSDKSRILRRYSPGMTRNSEMSTEPNQIGDVEKVVLAPVDPTDSRPYVRSDPAWTGKYQGER